MAIISAKPRFSELIAEFGSDGSPTLKDYLRGGARLPYSGNPDLADISTTAAGIRLSQFAGKQKEFVLSLTGAVRIFNARSHFDAVYGAPTGPVLMRLLINSGCHVFSELTGSWPLIIGDWPTGSRMILENRGQISGARGTPNSGSGGHCIYHSGANNVFLDIQNYGVIAPGGGAGGVGGTGGQGYYQTPVDNSLGLGQNVSGSCNNSCTTTYGAGAYCQSAGYPDCNVNPTFGTYQCGNCRRITYTNNYTTGGAGGSGGYGWGVYNSAGATASATVGNAGANGGTNAGKGGTGGSGGGPGANGGTGNTGASGNYTSGSGGGGGGASGYWLYYKTGLANLSVAGTVYGPSVVF